MCEVMATFRLSDPLYLKRVAFNFLVLFAEAVDIVLKTHKVLMCEPPVLVPNRVTQKNHTLASRASTNEMLFKI